MAYTKTPRDYAKKLVLLPRRQFDDLTVLAQEVGSTSSQLIRDFIVDGLRRRKA